MLLAVLVFCLNYARIMPVFKNCSSFFLPSHPNQKCTIRKKYPRRYKDSLYERVKRRVFSELNLT